jgi:hypothetical protein
LSLSSFFDPRLLLLVSLVDGKDVRAMGESGGESGEEKVVMIEEKLTNGTSPVLPLFLAALKSSSWSGS